MTLDEFVTAFEACRELPWIIEVPERSVIHSQCKRSRLRSMRGFNSATCHCPITAVAEHQGLGHFPPSCVADAATLLRLSPGDAGTIIGASDLTHGTVSEFAHERDLRARLLAAVGKSEEERS